MNHLETTYRQALAYLNSFIDYEKGMPRTYSPLTFNLARTAHLLELLGQPQERYPCLLIAGTKGKGSTAAFLESALRAAGYRTGLYISPHLHSWRERIQVDRELIPKGSVASWIERLRPLVEQVQARGEQGSPTYYEISTALALGYFAAQEVQVAVLEVGLGGRFDATNVVTPLVSILTPIGYDHMEILGDTLTEIAGEKAGIIKPAGWVVTAPQEEEAMTVVEQVCRERQACLWVAQPERIEQPLPEAPPRSYPIPLSEQPLSLPGFFQRINARVATAALQAMRERGWALSPSAIAAGLRETRWPARLEVIARHPWLVVDGAHNVDSAQVLRRALRQEFSFRHLILILGFSQGHDVGAFVREIGPAAQHLIATASRHPRALPAAQVAEQIASSVDIPVERADTMAQALDRAQQLAEGQDLICAAGSLFVAAEVREIHGLATEVD